MDDASKQAITPVAVAAEAKNAMKEFPSNELALATSSEDGPQGLKQLIQPEVFTTTNRVLKAYQTIKVLPSSAGMPEPDLKSLLSSSQAVEQLVKRHGIALLHYFASFIEPQQSPDHPPLFVRDDVNGITPAAVCNLCQWIKDLKVLDDKIINALVPKFHHAMGLILTRGDKFHSVAKDLTIDTFNNASEAYMTITEKSAAVSLKDSAKLVRHGETPEGGWGCGVAI